MLTLADRAWPRYNRLMTPLETTVRELCRAVDTVDWDPTTVQARIRTIHAQVRRASPAELEHASQLLVERVAASTPEDADGAAHVAITAGSLVEFGADPEPLGQAMLAKLPPILKAARGFADTCLADPRCPDAYPDSDDLDVLVEVDDRPIPLELFRERMADDLAGGAALHRLREWCLPAIAAWTRRRSMLDAAVSSEVLRHTAAALEFSAAHFVHVLMGVQRNALWTVLCPLEKRGFRVRLDGVVSNYDLHVLLGDALAARGIGSHTNSPALLDFVRGKRAEATLTHVAGCLAMYDYRAVGADLRSDNGVPLDFHVWGEGRPSQVPLVDGVPVLVVGPQTIRRTWSPSRVFQALPCDVWIEEELSPAAYRACVEAIPSS